MRRAAFHTLWSHWWRNPWQLFTLVAGLALATALWSGVQAINAEARASYAEAANSIDGQGGSIVRRDAMPLSTRDYVVLRRQGWLVSPVLEGRLGSVRLLGLEPLTLTRGTDDTGNLGAAEDFFQPQGILFAHPDDVASVEGLGPSVRVDPGQTRGIVTGDISVVQRLLDRPDQISRLLVGLEQSLTRGALPAQFELRQPEASSDVGRLTDSFHLNLTAFGLLSFAVGIFIVYGAIGLAFEQRRPVFRTMRALGLPLRSLAGLLVLELGVIAVVAGLLGVALGYVIAAALLPDVAVTLRGLYGADVAGELRLRASWWLSGVAMSLLGTALAASGAIYGLFTTSILSGAHPRALAMGSTRTAVVLGAVSAALGGLALLILAFGDGLLAGFSMLACLLIGAALALPLAVIGCLRFVSRWAKSPVAQWFWADTRQQVPGLSLALMALLLAMAANIGVSTMVSSFRLTFVGYLDQRLSSELYLRFGSEEHAAEVTSWLSSRGTVVLPVISAPTRVGGLPAQVFGIIDDRTYRDSWPLLAAEAGVWDRLHAGRGVLINEQLSRRQSLSAGDRLPGGDLILGVYSDYGNPMGQIIQDMASFQSLYPDATALRFGVRTDDPERLARELRARFDLGTDALIDQAQLKAFSISVFERTFAVTAALNVLTLAVAALAMLFSLLTLAAMRLPQLAPVWALGMTRAALARLELLRAVVLAAITGAFAVPLGLALAWVLLAIVNVEAFGWRLPMFTFPSAYLGLGLSTLLAAALAALWPAIRLARTPPARLLQVFSNAR